MSDLGYPESEHLLGTPKRVSRFFKDWHTIGKDAPIMTTFQSTSDQMVVVKNVPVFSMCAHHGLPFYGMASVGYVPKNRVVGLSKIPRLIHHYASRFQVQEDLTSQIADAFMETVDPNGVGVHISCQHMCMMMRGIKSNGTTITTALRGCFQEPGCKSEWLGQVGVI